MTLNADVIFGFAVVLQFDSPTHMGEATMAATKKLTPAQKGAQTRKRRAAGRKAAATRKRRASAAKAAATRKKNKA